MPSRDTEEAARVALALAAAVCEADQAGVNVILAAYADRPRLLLDGSVHVLRSLALQRVLDAGGCYSEQAIAAELRSLLQGAFAERI